MARQYTVSINGSNVPDFIQVETSKNITRSIGTFNCLIHDPENTLYDSINIGDLFEVLGPSSAVLFRGLIDGKIRVFSGGKRRLQIDGFDFNGVLLRTLVNKSYDEIEVTVIARDFMNQYVSTSALLDNMDATTGWAAGSDFGTLTTDSTAANRAIGSALKITATYSAGVGTLAKTMSSTKTILSTDLIGMYVKVPAVANLGTNIVLRFGQDSSNYWTVTKATSTLSAGWNWVEFDVSTKASGAGSPTLTAVDYYQLRIDVASGTSGAFFYFDEFWVVGNDSDDFTFSGISNTTKILGRVNFKNQPMFDSLNELTKYLTDYVAYFDSSRNLVFEQKGVTSSGVTISRGVNLLSMTVDDDTSNMVNKVKIVGGRRDWTSTQAFDGTGSQTTFVLTYKPVSMRVAVSGVEKIGFKPGMIATASFDYEFDKENKSVIFNTAPAVGVGNVSVEYVYGAPISINARSQSSIDSTYLSQKILNNEVIDEKQEGIDVAIKTLKEYKEPIQISTIVTQFNSSLDVRKTVNVVNSTIGVNQSFTIVDVRQFVGNKIRTTIQVAQTPKNLNQFIGELAKKVNQLEEFRRGDTEMEIFLEQQGDQFSAADDPPTNLVGLSQNINDSFIADHAVNGLMYGATETTIIDDFETTANWSTSGVGLSIANDSTSGHYWIGTQGVKATYTAGSTQLVSNTDAQGDLSGISGVASGTPTRGTVGLWVYADSANASTASSFFHIRIGTDSSNFIEYNGQTYQQKVAATEASISLPVGERRLMLFDLDGAQYNSSGTVNWTSINYITVRFLMDGSAANEDLTFDYLTASRDNTISLNGIGERDTTRSANMIAGASD